MVSVCFVCLGNICRSPTAEGVMAHLVKEAGLADVIALDSAGTGAWHVGEPPDGRSTREAARRGVHLQGAARRFEPGDFDRFDLVLAMDRSNLRELQRLAVGPEHQAKIKLLRAFEPGAPEGAEVPDPYYGAGDGFARVFDICDAACRGLLAHVRERHGI